MARDRSHRSAVHHTRTQPTKPLARHDSRRSQPLTAGSRQGSATSTGRSSSSSSATRGAPLVGDSLSSFVLRAPSSSSAPTARLRSAPSHSLSLPLVLSPLQRPFSSVQRGLYHCQPWPVHCSHGSQPPRDEDGPTDDSGASFRPPQSELPYRSSSLFQLLALPVVNDTVALSQPGSDSARPAQSLQSSIRLPLLRDASAATNAPSPSQGQSRNALLALTVRDRGEDWLVVVFATGATSSTLALLTVPAAFATRPSTLLSSSGDVSLSAELLDSVSPAWLSAPTESAITRIECCDSPPLPVYSSLACLPLVVAHNEQQATVYCLTRRVAASTSHPAPLLRLTTLDTLRPFTSPLLTVTANHRLCSPSACEIAAVDAGGCLYIWNIQAGTRIEEQHHLQARRSSKDEGAVGEAEEPSELAESGAALDSRHVRLILRSSYDAPNRISSASLLPFVRCFFAPHPRSILLALPDSIVAINLSSVRTDGVSDDAVDSRVLRVPVLSATSLPVNRYRRAPDRPQLIRDYFFPYQLYRAAQRTQQRALKAEPLTERKEEKVTESGEQSVQLPSGPAPRNTAEQVESGELLDAVCVPGFQFVLAVLSSSYVQLVDIRHSEQPMVEWQHEQRYSSSRRPAISAYTTHAGSGASGRHVLLMAFE